MVSTYPSLAGKVAIITGAGTGIGADTALYLAEQGVRVTIVGRTESTLKSVEKRIQERKGDVLVVAGDVSKPDDMERVVRKTLEHFGALHYAVNNAGISSDNQDIPNMSVSLWDSTIAVNLSSLFYCLKVQLPAIEKSGGGSIVNVSSVFADRGLPLRSAYTSSKHAIRGLTRSSAIDWASRGIRINELQPGVIDTPMASSAPGETEIIKKQIAAQRLGKGREVAAAIAFLLSDEASYVVGAHLAVDGGFLA